LLFSGAKIEITSPVIFVPGGKGMEPLSLFTPRAGLAALGLRLRAWQVWDVIRDRLQIKQKVHTHQPLDKVLDCFINILAGGAGLVEINLVLRPDAAVQRAFGRQTCAEQSTISDTLNVCTPENVDQLRSAIQIILQKQGQSYAHDYETAWQVLDIDTTGLPAGRLGEGVTKGYFAGHKSCRGRQLGRVVASAYDEIIVDQLYPGKRQLESSLPRLVEMAETALNLGENQRARTVLRVDAGGGSETNINWILNRGYGLLIKIHNWQRVRKLIESVTHWYTDPHVPGRQVGWVEVPYAYAQATRQVALRKLKPNGQWLHQVLVFNLTDEVLFAALAVYDQRGGGAETQNKGNKQGLHLAHRNKHSFVAQEILVLLAQLAHNLLIWTRNDLARDDDAFAHYGIQRMVRDVLQIPGCVQLDMTGQVVRITLQPSHPLAAKVQRTFLERSSTDEM
jgi:hypothetical protein